MEPLSREDIRKIQLNLLLSFADFCDRNNLKYYLCGGTLLGAIRHKGFIPWDDDIDVCMLRDDYDKFIELTKENKIKENISISCVEFNNSVYPFIKVLDDTTTINCISNTEDNKIWIDVFPIDNVPSTKNLIFKKARFYRNAIYIKITNHYSSGSKFKYNIRKILKFFLFFIPTTYFSKKSNNNSKSYKGESDYVAGVAWGYGPSERMHKSVFEGTKYATFEGHEFKIIPQYDVYLSALYGDYLQLPPENKRYYHGFIAYKIDENE